MILDTINGIFDSHAHYDDKAFDQDREALLSSLPEKGVARVVDVGSDLQSSAIAAILSQSHSFLYFAAGIHPSMVEGLKPDYLTKLKKLLRQNKAVALGEIGLDYHYGKENAALQRDVFEAQMHLAQEEKIPVIIHTREATQDTLKILKRFPTVKGVVHCFSGSAQTALQLVQMGYYIGFTGVVTFNNAKKAAEAASVVPLDRLLVETDCPYMAPVPFRGNRCDSTMLPATITKLAQIHQLEPQQVADLTYQNAARLFGIK